MIDLIERVKEIIDFANDKTDDLSDLERMMVLLLASKHISTKVEFGMLSEMKGDGER